MGVFGGQPGSRAVLRLPVKIMLLLVAAWLLVLCVGYAQQFQNPFSRYEPVHIDIDELPRMPTLHLVGDSSMCRGGTNNGVKGVKYEGWGEFAQDYFECKVTSYAISGRSSRMYTWEGRFDRVFNATKPGDYVVMQFGRNDKGKLRPKDNGKAVCPGRELNRTCRSIFKGKKVDVLTFGGYLANATARFRELGANVIIAAPTNNNPYGAGDSFYAKPTEWGPLSKITAEVLNLTWVDHFLYGTEMMRRLGKNETQKLYPVQADRSHTNPLGADFMARAFVRGLMCTDSGLSRYVNATAAQRITGGCLPEMAQDYQG
ncbi:hypothetical protein DRE_06090 [Drechslerella stenobrocha 248]|uniref:Uncharacterized protein n=1 Tax=Drechslerella stenobrocha 248 TaxID=1043628 RepID=W7HYG1_9PEZI|nr:hypothetical protein DRE_06090 [Drechslerella stenobrocha 248]